MMNHLTVAQNIFIGREIMNGKLINDAKMNQEAAKLFDRLNIKIDPTEKMGNLTVGRQQMCEIAKAISHDAKVIIFDEPSAALTEAEIEELFKIIRDLRDKGMGIVYISHRMDEIKVITDRVTVMRDGEHIITEDTVNLTEDSLINAMVGRTLDNLYPKEFGTKGEVWLEAKGLNEAGVLHDVSFKAHAGQITGFEGYMESAASGLLAARNLYARLQGRELPPPPTTTMCGALIDYITTPNKDFQPMGANMGILPRTEEIDTIRDKRERYMALSDAAQAAMRAWAAEAEH